MDKKEILYNVATARQFCENLDRNSLRVHEIREEINNDEKKFAKKEKMFEGKNFILMYLLITVLTTIPFSLITLFLKFHIEIFLPIFGLTVTLLIEKHYKKKKLPSITKVHKQAIKNKEKSIDDLISLLYADCENYELVLYDIPEDLRYPLALDFIHESIRQDHVFVLEDAFVYFRNHLEKIKKNDTKEAEKLIKEVEEALKIKKIREEIIEQYIQIDQ